MDRNSFDTRASSEFPRLSPTAAGLHTRTSLSSRPSTQVGAPPTNNPEQNARHQRFVLADPVAFSYLEEDRHSIVLERSRYLQGYQSYVVEQWACSRSHPTFIIIAYTGDSTHSIRVGVLSVPADEDSWSPRLRVYFKSLARYHAQRKDTPLGALMVTNLSLFPSSLTIVHIPDGDAHKHREDFFVAENLKRLGCSGRVGLSLAEPSGATQAKFYQLYKVSEKINLYAAVIELVKLCQVALTLFGCLAPEYADGLLCDITERAMTEWWAQIGTDLYNIEPSDGILGPTSVAALLGTLIGARNRLSAAGAPVTKDVFDVEPTKRAIATFQRMHRLPKTRRFDRRTLDRLHKATLKQAAGEGWIVPRAVKSTVAELSGRGGEMVMDMVGRGDKANMTEIETVDIDAFTHLVRGERAQWLWHAKPRKRTTRDMFNDIPHSENLFSPLTAEENPSRSIRPNLSRTSTQAEQGSLSQPDPPSLEPITSGVDWTKGENLNNTEEGPYAKHSGAFQRAKGRLKGVVGLRPPTQGGSRDSTLGMSPLNGKSVESLNSITAGQESPSSLRKSGEVLREQADVGPGAIPKFSTSLTDTPVESTDDVTRQRTTTEKAGLDAPIDLDERLSRAATADKSDMNPLIVTNTASTMDEASDTANIGPRHRARSLPGRPGEDIKRHHENWWPRQLSFSAASTAILTASTESETVPTASPTTFSPSQSPANPREQLTAEKRRTESAITLHTTLNTISDTTAKWVASVLAQVEDIGLTASQDAEQLQSLYYPRKHEVQSLQHSSAELLGDERRRLQDALREVETLGQKLEYEVGGLRSKVEDMESTVDEFEKKVVYAEARVKELVRNAPSRGGGVAGQASEKEGWGAWVQRSLFSRLAGAGS